MPHNENENRDPLNPNHAKQNRECINNKEHTIKSESSKLQMAKHSKINKSSPNCRKKR